MDSIYDSANGGHYDEFVTWMNYLSNDTKDDRSSKKLEDI